jgi:hypothetical protein
MTPLDAAVRYAAAHEWPVFPCASAGERVKRPLTAHGLYDASRNPAVIREWWRHWPNAFIGLPTGNAIGAAVLDIDVKDDHANGFDSLDALGFAILPDTPMAHTASGGLHLYFALPAGVEIRNTAGASGSGIGPGLDWRGQGGYVIAPSPGSGYAWDPLSNLDTVLLAAVPPALLPKQPERSVEARPVGPAKGLSPYAEAALDNACRRIIGAPYGEQELTLNGECYAIGTLAGADSIPASFALRTLRWAARQIPNYDRRRPWSSREIEAKVERAFSDGLRHPREARRA